MRIYEITPGQRKPIKIKLDTIEKFGQFWDKAIEPNCSDVLKVYRTVEKVYLRGEQNMPDIFRGASRVDRPARDSNQLLAQIFDKCLLDLGFEAIRSNSIFTSGSKIITSEFGNVYMIFPINGFKFTFINEEDLVLNTFRDIVPIDIYDLIQDKFRIWASNNNLPVNVQAWGKYYLQTPTTLDDIVAHLKQIIPDDDFIQNLTTDMLIDCKNIKRLYRPTSTDLKYALKNDLETLIKGSYYAIAFDQYFKLANKKLGFLIKQ